MGPPEAPEGKGVGPAADEPTLRLTGFFMSRSSLSFCSSAAFLGMTSACGSFLGLGGRTEDAAGLAMTVLRFPSRAAAARTSDDRDARPRRKRSLPAGRNWAGSPAAEYS